MSVNAVTNATTMGVAHSMCKASARYGETRSVIGAQLGVDPLPLGLGLLHHHSDVLISAVRVQLSHDQDVLTQPHSVMGGERLLTYQTAVAHGPFFIVHAFIISPVSSPVAHLPAMDIEGVKVSDLPPAYVPLEAIVLMKALDEDGDAVWLVRTSDGLSDAERLGALIAESGRLKKSMIDRFVSEEDDGG